MEPPKIFLSRYEHSVVVRWDDDPTWYRFEPDDLKYLQESLRRKFVVGTDDDLFAPDHEWIDVFADPRPDIHRWTGPMRDQLRGVLSLLDSAEQHPWSG